MAQGESWVDIGSAQELAQAPLRSGKAGNIPIAISYQDGQFGVVSNACNHVGGPLGDGRLDHDYITCPWHGWKFHRCTGRGEPGFEEDRVPAFPVRVEGGRVLVNVAAPTRRHKSPHPPHPLDDGCLCTGCAEWREARRDEGCPTRCGLPLPAEAAS